MADGQEELVGGERGCPSTERVGGTDHRSSPQAWRRQLKQQTAKPYPPLLELKQEKTKQKYVPSFRAVRTAKKASNKAVC